MAKNNWNQWNPEHETSVKDAGPVETKNAPSTKPEELRKAEKELADAQFAANADRKKQLEIEKTRDVEARKVVPAPKVSDAEFESNRKANLEREKVAKIDVARRRSEVSLERELAAIDEEYAPKPVSAAGSCPTCKSTSTIFVADGKSCNSCGHAWGGVR